MKFTSVLLLVLLAGCNATMPQQAPRPTANDDPSLRCYAQMDDDQRLAVLTPKIGSPSRAAAATLQQMALTDKPNEEEKAAISVWASSRKVCTDAGRSFRAQWAPPGYAAASDDAQQQFLGLMARLYAGEMSYGEFTRARQDLGASARARLLAVEQNATAAAQQRQSAQAADTANNLLIMQMLQPKPLPMPAPIVVPRQTVCNSYRIGNQVQTTCN